MLSNECHLGQHQQCSAVRDCECFCHVDIDDLIAELMEDE